MRYTLQLETLAGDDAPGDRRAIDLLHSELTLALNASYFAVVTAGDIELEVLSRSTPQEGVTRYVVRLYFEEASSVEDEQGLANLRLAFAAADNASYFMRVSTDGISLKLLSRDWLTAPTQRRAA